MHVVLASVGSLGDVHPFIAIGRAMRARGHRVTLICNDDHRCVVENSGIEFATVGPAVDLSAAMAHPNLWHPIKGLGVFWRTMLAPAIEPTFRQIERMAWGGRCLVFASPTMFGARFARDALGVRVISAITAPAILRSDRAPLMLAHWRLPRGTPRSAIRLAWRALDHYKLHPMASTTLRNLATRLGAAAPPAGASVFGTWMFSPDGALTLFPEWFGGGRRGGWPENLTFGGFPLHDDTDDTPGESRLPDHVEHFLKDGEAPLVFMPGTAMRHSTAFFSAAAAACGSLGQRAILLSPERGQLPDRLPDGVIHMPYLPFGSLLPRSLALIHHGGIGSCAQALRAGIPQLLMPMAYDQFDNAECVVRLGAGAVLRPEQFDTRRLTAAVTGLRDLPAPALAACRQQLQRSALPQLCEALEALA